MKQAAVVIQVVKVHFEPRPPNQIAQRLSRQASWFRHDLKGRLHLKRVVQVHQSRQKSRPCHALDVVRHHGAALAPIGPEPDEGHPLRVRGFQHQLHHRRISVSTLKSTGQRGNEMRFQSAEPRLLQVLPQRDRQHGPKGVVQRSRHGVRHECRLDECGARTADIAPRRRFVSDFGQIERQAQSPARHDGPSPAERSGGRRRECARAGSASASRTEVCPPRRNERSLSFAGRARPPRRRPVRPGIRSSRRNAALPGSVPRAQLADQVSRTAMRLGMSERASSDARQQRLQGDELAAVLQRLVGRLEQPDDAQAGCPSLIGVRSLTMQSTK